MSSKRFRWAVVSSNSNELDDDDVQVQVHEVECWKDRTDLWWNDSEYLNIKNGVLATTQFCKSNDRSHIELLEEIIKRMSIMKNTNNGTTTSHHHQQDEDNDDEEEEEEEYQNNLLKDLSSSSSDTCSRGLEGLMCQLINRYRKIHSRKVLNAAYRYQKNNNEDKRKDAINWNALREQSMKKSRPLSSFARKMGQLDEMQARHQ
eukprot:scaffold4501_cov118-Cylindrotheca_fusiformis.AAC.2